MESKIAHLEMVQAVITRMAGNSFLIKGWSVTLVAARRTIRRTLRPGRGMPVWCSRWWLRRWRELRLHRGRGWWPEGWMPPRRRLRSRFGPGGG